ncbi:M12 family metallopeptidase [Pseudomonas sp. NPDC087346]|uniref:M12 family metallopeptidase n=1 Tax=Pseudomonas sp. NPDC087346 TaxID=3364438 RepID=UPI0037F1066A
MIKSTPCMKLHIEDPYASYQAAVSENPDNALKNKGGLLAVGIESKLWKPGRTLTISFLGKPSESLKDLLKALILEWEPLVNLTFKFVEGNDGIIKIQTNARSNASHIGTDALLYGPGEPTMFIANQPSNPEFRASVLHEFGHVLGLHHEHLHPDADIPWNRKKVYEVYASKWGMSKELVDLNIFTPISEHVMVGKYDQDSVMHYPVEKELTDGKLEVSLNSNISSEDKRIIQILYPLTPPGGGGGGDCEQP